MALSREVVGWEVFEAESAANASGMIRCEVPAEAVIDQPLVLHADNGSPFKGATLLATLRALKITPSSSRPRVSDDNAFSEALFRTCQYVPSYPVNGFEGLEAARRKAIAGKARTELRRMFVCLRGASPGA
ncbi:DDE-type integrase/transposase/recombinase [Halochromatium glycolicum]|nr:DDE-type integrase/transposase/recombinase [Halochromatium glycolicum]